MIVPFEIVKAGLQLVSARVLKANAAVRVGIFG